MLAAMRNNDNCILLCFCFTKILENHPGTSLHLCLSRNKTWVTACLTANPAPDIAFTPLLLPYVPSSLSEKCWMREYDECWQHDEGVMLISLAPSGQGWVNVCWQGWVRWCEGTVPSGPVLTVWGMCQKLIHFRNTTVVLKQISVLMIQNKRFIY